MIRIQTPVATSSKWTAGVDAEAKCISLFTTESLSVTLLGLPFSRQERVTLFEERTPE
jgi:hypothetical protein